MSNNFWYIEFQHTFLCNLFRALYFSIKFNNLHKNSFEFMSINVRYVNIKHIFKCVKYDM